MIILSLYSLIIIIKTSSIGQNDKNKVVLKLLSQPHKHLRHENLLKKHNSTKQPTVDCTLGVQCTCTAVKGKLFYIRTWRSDKWNKIIYLVPSAKLKEGISFQQTLLKAYNLHANRFKFYRKIHEIIFFRNTRLFFVCLIHFPLRRIIKNYSS